MEVSTIQSALENILPQGTYLNVKPYKGMSDNYIAIQFASLDFNINGVSGQRPDAVSLSLCLNDLELLVQMYGGCGGNRIYRKPNLEDPKEKYLAMKGVKVPFRQPQKNEVAVLKAIKTFALNWIKTIKENKDSLYYKDKVDYSKF